MVESMRRSVSGGLRGMGHQLEAFVKGMDLGDQGDMARVHGQIARDMHEAVMDAYATNVEGQRKVPSYQRQSRLAGHLGRMVRRRDFVQSDASGIGLGLPTAVMDKEAAHWNRMNFGAGQAAGDQPGPYPIRLFGETVATAELPSGPSKPFVLPKGFFIQGGRAVAPQADFRGSGSEGPFVVSRKSPYRPAVTSGIRGRHFMEAGLEVMAEQLPIRYADLLNEWVQRGGDAARAISSTITT